MSNLDGVMLASQVSKAVKEHIDMLPCIDNRPIVCSSLLSLIARIKVYHIFGAYLRLFSSDYSLCEQRGSERLRSDLLHRTKLLI